MRRTRVGASRFEALVGLRIPRLYRGTHGPPVPNIIYAMTRTATIALPISNIVCLSTATSLLSTGNLLSFTQSHSSQPLELSLCTLQRYGRARLFKARSLLSKFASESQPLIADRLAGHS